MHNITPIIEGIISVLFLIVTIFVVPMLKGKISADKLSTIMQYVDIFVATADQIFDTVDGEKKKEYAMQKLEAKLAELGLVADVDFLDSLVEASVLKLHNELKSGEKKCLKIG